MADKKISTTEKNAEKNEQDSNQKRKKASTGAWWKSTTAEEKTVTESSSKPAAERKKNESKLPATAVDTVEPAETPVPAEQAALKKPARKRPARKKPVVKKQDADSAVDIAKDEAATHSSAPAEAVVETNDEKVEAAPEVAKPRRKRGRPRKKPVEKAEEAQESVTLSALQVKKISEEPEEIAEEASKVKPPRRKRSPRKKKSAPATSGTLDIDQDLPITASPSVAELSDVSGEQTIIPAEKGDDAAAVEVEVKGRPGAPRENDSPDESAGSPQTADKAAPSAKREEHRKEKQSFKKEEAEEHKPIIKLLINAEEPEECRLALLEDGRLESIHVATSTRTQTKNNIYKARIVAIEPNLQAAFVEYGTEKNGFLPFSEIHPEYYKENVSEKVQKLIDQHQWKKLSITDVVERGREVLVQVVKEEVGSKGANMTTYLSLPGRCVVLMPGSDSTGISRKISGEERRSRLREYLLSMDIPEGIGWIVRTASNDITKTALARDVNYLLNLWEEVKKKGQELDGVGMVYQDHDHVLRFLREHFDPDIQEILVDDKDALEQVKGFIELLPSKQRKVRCKLHGGARPIFNQYSIEDQIESIYQPKVGLPSGGSIVIDPTEALVAIDVNSGSTGKGKNFEDTIFLANMEAAKELARQLRLRDLGGLIVVDFIDMRSSKNIREVEKEVKNAMKRDKAKVDISRISKFGLMQISRQKLGAPIEAGNYRVCSNCKGRGIVRSVETLALFYLRRIQTAASRKTVMQIECRFPLDVAQYLLNNKRQELRDLENKYDTEVVIIADPSLKPADNEIIFHKSEKDESRKKQS